MDADAFYATVHEVLDPSLKGKPVVVAGRGMRSVVTTASYEARRRYGIHSAMSAARASMLAPDAIFITPDFPSYRAVSQQAMSIVRREVKVIETVSLDEAYLDLTGHGDPVTLMRQLVDEIKAATQVQYSVGLSESKLCAKVLSDYDKPAAFNVMTREQCQELFADRPPRMLPGVGPKTAERLEQMGVHTVAQLAQTSVHVLEARFGPRTGTFLAARGRFIDDALVTPRTAAKSKSKEDTFPEDVTDLDELTDTLRRLADGVADQLVSQDRKARTVGIKVRLNDFSVHTRARTLDEHVNDVRVIADVACELMREFGVPRPVRLVGVRVAGFEDELHDDADEEPSAQLELPLG